ncbi:hypothetical protein [Streptomyces sp. cg36]|uniref:hypothetical protein n=1 Tax=Streptomyces sp. cg36 TaxID=3238798 RepID=UPI0034E1BE75
MLGKAEPTPLAPIATVAPVADLGDGRPHCNFSACTHTARSPGEADVEVGSLAHPVHDPTVPLL